MASNAKDPPASEGDWVYRHEEPRHQDSCQILRGNLVASDDDYEILSDLYRTVQHTTAAIPLQNTAGAPPKLRSLLASRAAIAALDAEWFGENIMGFTTKTAGVYNTPAARFWDVVAKHYAAL